MKKLSISLLVVVVAMTLSVNLSAKSPSNSTLNYVEIDMSNSLNNTTVLGIDLFSLEMISAGEGTLEKLLYKYKSGDTASQLINHIKFDSLREDFRIIYKTIFDKLFEENPDLNIIYHGYDYPYLIGKEKNWFGKPMRRKNIDGIKLRSEIARILIASFNEMLKQLSSAYPSVHYIDLRNNVPRNKWKDELHPNEEDFKIVAEVFKSKIDEIV